MILIMNPGRRLIEFNEKQGNKEEHHKRKEIRKAMHKERKRSIEGFLV